MNFRGMIHLIVACTLFLSLSVLPASVSSSHYIASTFVEETSRHKVLNPVQVADEDHSHDDGEDHEKIAGHTHGHDPADHSHQVVLFSGTVLADVHRESDTPLNSVPDLVKLETDFGIDRPPKGASFA